MKVLDEYEIAYDNGKNPDAQPAFDPGGSKAASGFNGYCLAYVKFALRHTNMISAYPTTAGVAKKSVKEWPQFGYRYISKELPQVAITYNNVYSEKDASKIKQHITDKDATDESYKALQAKTGAADKAVAITRRAMHVARIASVNPQMQAVAVFQS